MKKVLLTLLTIIVLTSVATAQWVSPGNGTTYTMDDLVAASNGTVTSIGTKTYRINNDITISANDTWNITSDIAGIALQEVTVTVNGTMNAIGSAFDKTPFSGDRVPFILIFDNATANISGISFTKGNVVNIIASNVTFNGCDFKNFVSTSSTSAVNFLNCNPSFLNCVFTDNEGAAISSGINVQGSPRIQNCTFTNNVTTNKNVPQINLGPGAADTIYIINCTITGGNSVLAGGISISDIAGVGSTKARIEGNTVVNNRYGYNQQGMTISSVIYNNKFLSNNIENNPMTGGSGISIYGLSTNCKAKIRKNTIMENLWGITAINLNEIDLGTEDDWGYNNIFKNNNEDDLIELYNNSSCNIMAVGNYWGQDDADDIEKHIYHFEDDNSLGEVLFKPFLTNDGIVDNQEINITIAPNPVVNGIVTITVENEMQSEMSIYNAAGQIVVSQTLYNQTNNIDVNSLESGVYFVVIRNGGSFKVEKIIKK